MSVDPARTDAGDSGGRGDEQAIRAAAARIATAGESRRRPGRDPVNLPMVRNWLEALGDTNPLYTDPVVADPRTGTSAGASAADGSPALVAPPAMIQVWTMPGLGGRRADDDPLSAMMTVLDEAGYTAVVATNCSQTYHRYLHLGEHVSVSARLDDVSGPKRTALGEGWFVTTRSTWYVGDEPVAEMSFRVLKFRPAPAPRAGAGPATAAAATEPPTGVIQPVVSRDTKFFWDGVAHRELRIQRCGGCGRLRHPPGPMCPACGSERQGHVVSGGTGTVFSYVVHHRPPVPGRTAPFVVGLIELEEGVRMLGEIVGVAPADVRVGDRVALAWQATDEALTLPAWRPEGAS